ncbi:hypothetical protein DdX_17387 [Ditylenchus destructor]|uniref:Uncharacterized protein n=1 Tax=Ditylenchus destructor TaxID=166010 RepID=A0AAD4MM93_9BILA|nr:hypothetical protein DdX_17387 [Ditylenchus destructor]
MEHSNIPIPQNVNFTKKCPNHYSSTTVILFSACSERDCVSSAATIATILTCAQYEDTSLRRGPLHSNENLTISDENFQCCDQSRRVMAITSCPAGRVTPESAYIPPKISNKYVPYKYPYAAPCVYSGKNSYMFPTTHNPDTMQCLK